MCYLNNVNVLTFIVGFVCDSGNEVFLYLQTELYYINVINAVKTKLTRIVKYLFTKGLEIWQITVYTRIKSLLVGLCLICFPD